MQTMWYAFVRWNFSIISANSGFGIALIYATD